MLDDRSDDAVGDLLDWMDDFSKRENVEFTISATVEPGTVGERISKYFSE